MKRLSQILLALALMVPAFAGDKAFTPDTNHTVIGFKASTVLFDVPGRFGAYKVEITGNPDEPSTAKVKLSIQTATINTAVKKRDDHLRSEDFFDAAKFPAIVFTSSKVWKDSGKVFVAGTLDMHGVKKDMTLAFDPIFAKNGAGVDTWAYRTTAKLSRKDFGIGVKDTLAAISLKDEVELNLLLVGFFEEPKAAAPKPSAKKKG